MRSNPDFDFPCHRTFYESDMEFNARFTRMSRLRDTLKEKELRLDHLEEVLDAERRSTKTVEWLNDTIYGHVSDSQMKKCLDFLTYMQRKVDEHTKLKGQMVGEVQELRKELSELTR